MQLESDEAAEKVREVIVEANEQSFDRLRCTGSDRGTLVLKE